VETNLPPPTTGRVYVNLLEGIIGDITILEGLYPQPMGVIAMVIAVYHVIILSYVPCC
jgi:hypothetical protein